MAGITSSKDLLMLLLYVEGHRGDLCGPVRGRTRLMKMVFLFDREIRKQFNLGRIVPDDAMPRFEAFDFGPFSAQVFTDLEFLVELGLVEVRTVGGSDVSDEEGYEYQYWRAAGGQDLGDDDLECEEEFSLTALGKGFVEAELIEELNESQINALREFKARCTAASLRSLLRYVYTKYPDMTTASKIRDKLLSRGF